MTDQAKPSYSQVGDVADHFDVTTPSTNVDITIQPETHELPKQETLTASWSELYSEAQSNDVFLMVLGTIGAAGVGIAVPIFNILFGKILDALNTNPDSFSTSIDTLCIDFVILAIVNLFCGWMQVTCWSIAGERQTQSFKEKYVQSILGQEIGWFDQCGASELATKVADLTGKVQDGIGRKSGDLAQYVVQAVASIAIALYFSWRLSLVLFCAIPAIAFAGKFMIDAVTAATSKSMEQYAAAGGLATETLGAIRTVTALNAQPDAITRYRTYLRVAMKEGITKGLKVGIGNGGLFGVCYLTYALGFWYGGQLISDSVTGGCGQSCITGGTVMAVFFNVIMGSIALGQIAPPLADLYSAKTAARPLLDVIHRKPLIDGLSSEGLQPESKPRGRVELRDVHFAYPSRPDALVCRGLSLMVEPGEVVAVVGASGSGKSTLINLLLRFYDPLDGSVMLDETNVKDLNVRWLRSNIGYVGQEPVLFTGTISDNILYGLDPTVVPERRIALESPDESLRQKATADLRLRVEEAAKLANAHEFIMAFPDGYDTDVGSNGASMSGGQKQRLAIARALIKKPSVLLLDEATSALDAASERLVQQSIDNLQQSKFQTTIVIAHRLSTIRGADKIAVVSHGKVAELGKHEELLAKGGLYADLIRLQMSNDEEDQGLSMRDLGHDHASPVQEDENLEQDLTEVQVNGYPVPAPLLKATKVGAIGALAEEVTGEALQGQTKGTDETELTKEETKMLNARLWTLVREQLHWFLLALAGSLIFGGIFPVWGLLLARTQEVFFYSDPDRIRARVAEIAGFFCLLALLALLSSTAQFYGISQMGERISMRLRSDLFQAVVRREIAFFDEERNAVGALTTRLADDSRTITKATGFSWARQLQAVCTLTVALALGLSASWKISLVVLACFPISIIASSIQMQAIAGQQYSKDGDGSGQGGIISSAFTHMRTVAAFSVQFQIYEEYSKKTRADCENRISSSYVAGFGFGASQMSMFLIYALLFWYGSQLILSGEVTFVQMMTAILVLMLGALGLGTALSDMGDQKAGLQAAHRIFKAVEESEHCPIDGLSLTGDRPAGTPSGRIELVNVRFAYPTRPETEVCRGYSLTIEPGEVVALVGPSGSGKSTIMGLLLRFYDPSSGSVLLDGQDIKSLNVRWLRAQIGYVGQEPKLFQGSVSDNIAKGRASFGDKPLLSIEEASRLADEHPEQLLVDSKGQPQTTSGHVSAENNVEITVGAVEEDIVHAAKLANAHDFISAFPQGYMTDVGEGSVMVSGGQKQRIAIARALIKRPSVLLLDEATSALDAASERLVQQSIDQLQQNKSQTTIVIAHRLSTIRGADKIAVIDHGSVVEIGKHDELLASGGLYAQLWNKQQGVSSLHRANSSDISLDT